MVRVIPDNGALGFFSATFTRKLLSDHDAMVGEEIANPPFDLCGDRSSPELYASGMRKKRLDSPYTDVSNAGVSRVESTQLDLGCLAQEELNRSGKDGRKVINHHPAIVEVGKVKPVVNGRHKTSELKCNSRGEQQSVVGGTFANSCKETAVSNCYSSGVSNATPGRVVSTNNTIHLPLSRASADSVSPDDNNLNAARTSGRVQQNRLLKQGSSRRHPHKLRTVGRPRKRLPREHAAKTPEHRVIHFPPNTELKITSNSALDVQECRLGKEADKLDTKVSNFKRYCPDESKKANNSAKLLASSGSTKASNRAFRFPSREVNKSNSSRYRLTPCPTVGTWRSNQGSGSASSSSKLTSTTLPSDGMSQRSQGSRLFRKSQPSYPEMSSFAGSFPMGRGRKRSVSKFSRRSSSCDFGRCSARHSGHSRYLSANSPRSDSFKDLLLRAHRKPSRSSRLHHRARRLRYRKSRTSVRRSSNKRSSSGRKKKRGRPRKSSANRSQARLIDAEEAAKAQREKRSSGLLSRFSNLWGSYSSSRSAETPAKSSSSSTSSSSWMSRILPRTGGKHERRQKRLREKSFKYKRAHKADSTTESLAQEKEQRRHRGGKDRVQKKDAPSVVCRIM
ncbi:hypothetical protein PoB_007252800 [Plakobranchus ocellatus]|uniref:Serine/arginine repetitive matrix protein C-terminal domain-containing protein n=1 Tax=Plakobranchus ocellatus TaxID=259542 RepID=A0AAV4DNV2_9GAST|nr:hypothetical protein PoB_007252800 [Plakobranchus ocellatus]